MRSTRLLWVVPVLLVSLGAGWLRAGMASGPPAAAAGAPKKVATPETYRSRRAMTAQWQRDLSRGLHYEVLAHGNPRLKVVALTFDDGPHPQYTPQLLDILRKSNVKATFFVVGEKVAESPDLVRMERSRGHIVGNHTYHHYNLTKLPPSQVLAEWQLCEDVVQKAIGQKMQFCRPPGGDYNPAVVRAAGQLGLTTVLWTDDPGDYASPGKKTIGNRLLGRIDNGGIILLHDGIQQTIDILPQMIQELRDRGFRFVTVSELQAGLGNDRTLR